MLSSFLFSVSKTTKRMLRRQSISTNLTKFNLNKENESHWQKMATRNETNKNFRSNFIFFKHGFLVKGQNTTKNICSLEEAVVGNVISYFRTLLKGLREFSFLSGELQDPGR